MSYKSKNNYIIRDGWYDLIITSEKFGEATTKIDIDDYDKVSKYHWNINFLGNKNKNKFLTCYVVNSKIGLLHRYILNAEKGKIVDHINRDSLDNRKENLRECTSKQNNMNRSISSTTKSEHKGVTWYPYRGINKWFAHIVVDGKYKSLGYYEDINDAVEARKIAEIEYFGEYARQEIS